MAAVLVIGSMSLKSKGRWMFLQYEIMPFLCSKPTHGSQLLLRKAQVLTGPTRPSKVWLAALLLTHPTAATLTSLFFLQGAQPARPSGPFHVVSQASSRARLDFLEVSAQCHLSSGTFPEAAISEHCYPFPHPLLSAPAFFLPHST